MPTLKDLDGLLTGLIEARAGMSVVEFTRRAIGEIRREFRGQKIYVAAPDTSKKQQIAQAARFLPAGVVALRHGVTQSYVRRVVKLARRGSNK